MSISAADLARHLGGTLHGDGDLVLDGVASPDDAGPGDLVFADSARRVPSALASAAGCVLLPPGTDPAGRNAIVVAEPKRAFVHAVALLLPPEPHPPGIHPSAVIDPTAELGTGVAVGPHVTVGAGARIGAGSVLAAGVVIGPRCRVGSDSILHPRVVLYPGTEIGERAVIHAGAVLGSDGFGFVRGPQGLEKFPQLGRLSIGDDVEIGANTTIDRGALGATRIGSGSKLDNLVQVAHNVQIGSRCALSSQVGVAGSTTIGDDVTLAGQAGIADRVRLDDGVIVGAQAGVPSGKLIRRGLIVWGTPARPLDEFKRQFAQLQRIGELRERVRALEEALARLGAPPAAGRDPQAEPSAIDSPGEGS